ncbi:hypothetical protein MP228_005553 [Amoeboaphelidium protococcarum]|nr:hypothetical protein MP228_005553 [Amoeboaphelidium protococcarum]
MFDPKALKSVLNDILKSGQQYGLLAALVLNVDGSIICQSMVAGQSSGLNSQIVATFACSSLFLYNDSRGKDAQRLITQQMIETDKYRLLVKLVTVSLNSDQLSDTAEDEALNLIFVLVGSTDKSPWGLFLKQMDKLKSFAVSFNEPMQRRAVQALSDALESSSQN